MEMSNKPEGFFEIIDECHSLIESSGLVSEKSMALQAEPLPSLLEQCHAITYQAEADEAPIRSIHHFACTGGTLFLKCLASMPNTMTISEVEPHSRVVPLEERRFSPTDWIGLVRASNRPLNDELVDALFYAGLDTLHDDCTMRGLHLVLRDHAHSHYCVGTQVAQQNNLRNLLSARPSTLSVVTVRHPLDSFLSLKSNNWLHFEPPTLDEYARRYQRFLSDHEDLPRFRYEKFVEDPQSEMTRLCEILELTFNPDFIHFFDQYPLSGNSGRTSSTIGPRGRRPVPPDTDRLLSEATVFLALCEDLGYDLN